MGANPRTNQMAQTTGDPEPKRPEPPPRPPMHVRLPCTEEGKASSQSPSAHRSSFRTRIASGMWTNIGFRRRSLKRTCRTIVPRLEWGHEDPPDSRPPRVEESNFTLSVLQGSYSPRLDTERAFEGKDTGFSSHSEKRPVPRPLRLLYPCLVSEDPSPLSIGIGHFAKYSPSKSPILEDAMCDWNTFLVVVEPCSTVFPQQATMQPLYMHAL
ncbi:hypothetical protein BDY17DRAFT_195064 [Neohortaea acidophila]|uniref:Uncharacterized protein n=1 Tax=Neohortaea acidophila TaxID=245834 RepID=A0A6A6PLN9_9PEZI|nr:uncharacterized protein BDY17DRAFT_195064 [Neohortaea acidophila]KAF2480574.1 hypothetical protein BDY17DRAFT_195064 [Neohortaea acidophila]